jgi:hypothetical protein
MSFPRLRNTLTRFVRPDRFVKGSELIRALMAVKGSSTQETESFAVQTEKSINQVTETITTIQKTLIDYDMTAKTKFIQTLTNQVTVTGATKTTLLDLTQGTAIFTPDDMAIGQSYQGRAYMEVTYDSGKDYDIFLSIGGQEVQISIPVGTPGPVANAMISLEWVLRFTGGPDTDRECYFVGEYQFIDIAGSFEGPYHLRIPHTLLQVDATQNQPVDISFQGTDGDNTCTTVDIYLIRM